MYRHSSVAADFIRQLAYRLMGGSGYRFLRTYYHLWYYSRHYKDPEQAILPYFVHPGDTVLDVGAHLGTYTLPLSKLVGEAGHVYSFEPVADTFRGLEALVKTGRLRNVHLIKQGVSNVSGTTPIFVPLMNKMPGLGHSHLNEISGEALSYRETITTITLDEFCNDRGLKNISFIKFDIEGSELMALQGAKKLLSEQQPAILSEIASKSMVHFGYTPHDFFRYLQQFGYQYIFYYDQDKPFFFDPLELPANTDINLYLFQKTGRWFFNFFLLSELHLATLYPEWSAT